MELQDLFGGHLGRPYGGREDEAIRCSRFRRIFAKLLRFSSRLGARSRDNHYILKSVVVQGLPGQTDRLLSLVMREVLRLPITALD